MHRRTTATVSLLAVSLLAVSLLAGRDGSARQVLRPDASIGVDQSATAGLPARRDSLATTRYRAQVFPSTTSSSAVYRTAPDLVSGAPVQESLTVYQPAGDVATSRPLIVWIHGGGFAVGDRSIMAPEADAYARLGYVTASIDYRLDPGNQCLQVQFGLITDPTAYAVAYARCQRAILGARDDAAAAIAWLRVHAVAYGIDTTRVAVAGSSAGAVTAINVGQTLNTPGNPPPAASRVSAVLAMSGCNYFDGTIDAADAPIAMVAAGGDPLIPFSCSAATTASAEAVGTPVARNFYALDTGHAESIYYAPGRDRPHVAAVPHRHDGPAVSATPFSVAMGES